MSRESISGLVDEQILSVMTATTLVVDLVAEMAVEEADLVVDDREVEGREEELAADEVVVDMVVVEVVEEEVVEDEAMTEEAGGTHTKRQAFNELLVRGTCVY